MLDKQKDTFQCSMVLVRKKRIPFSRSDDSDLSTTSRISVVGFIVQGKLLHHSSCTSSSGWLGLFGLDLLVIVNLGSSGGCSLLSEGGGNDISWDSEGLHEVVDSRVGDGVVRPLPVEDFAEETSALERFDDHLDFEVCNSGNALMLGKVAVFSDNDNSFSQKVGENCSLLFFANKYHAFPENIQ